MRTPAWLGSGMPLLFVLLWSTGFLGAKFGLPYAEPFTFLAIRLLLAAALLAAFALLSGAHWTGSARLAGHVAVAGLLVHGLYLGG
ncbi:EamA/RhaT family transporter, partial [Pseudomonas aeruginosa]|nr:EamA/RhaT family transporter [Pseudomonas aeruginosa]